MLKKKTNQPDINNAPMEKKSINTPNEVNTQVEIPMYAPNMGIEPKEYQFSPDLNDLITRFQSICMEFLNKANPDEYNSTYMDAVIDRICLESIDFLEVQRIEHKKLINKLIQAMHEGDLNDANNKLDQFLSDKEEIDRELTKYRRICWAGTSLEEVI